MFTSVKKVLTKCSVTFIFSILFLFCLCFCYWYTAPTYTPKDTSQQKTAKHILNNLDTSFTICAKLCQHNPVFLKSIVYPEVLRYNNLKDQLEATGLETLYIQYGKQYANFSIGLFQMKPSFAEEVEQLCLQHLDTTQLQELQLAYSHGIDTTEQRAERIKRLEDTDWQMVYLTGFVMVCDALYKKNNFNTEQEKLLWYGRIYNAGFNSNSANNTKAIAIAKANAPSSHFNYLQLLIDFYKSNS